MSTRRRPLIAASGAAVTTALVALVGAAPIASADTSPVPGLPASCLPEQYPAAGTPRSGSYVPYKIPFTATLGPRPSSGSLWPPKSITTGGGYLEVASPNSPFVVVFGGPISTNGTGQISASACGTVTLPNESGSISGNPYGSAANGYADQYNNNFTFAQPIPIAIYLKGVGVPLLNGYGTAVGNLAADIDLEPARNGGLNVEFYSSAKATSVLTAGAACTLLGISPIGLGIPPGVCKEAPNSPLPGGDCTLPIGDLRASGVPSADFSSLFNDAPDAEALATTPAHLSTTFSAKPFAPGYPTPVGQPVTGPITDAKAVLVANDFPLAKIDPNTPPSATLPPSDETSTPLCSSSNANLFNELLGLPSPAGYNTFYAPGTFAVQTSS